MVASSEAAKSTADANIYVALGTLLRLDNEDEVAALLGHEASHVILGHAGTWRRTSGRPTLELAKPIGFRSLVK